MQTSPGRRFLVVGLLVLLMFVPLFFASEVINGRKSYSAGTIASVGEEWGGAQSLAGPQLVIPVQSTVVTLASRPRLDDAGAVMLDDEGNELSERFEKTVIQSAEPIRIYPERLDATLETVTQIRSRGIFRVPVFSAQAEIAFHFDTSLADRVLADKERILWERAALRMSVSNNRALRGAAEVTADGRALALAPLTAGAGFSADLGDPRGVQALSMQVGFNGAQSLMIAPVGRESAVVLRGDWPHPSFSGAFLPDGSEVSDAGFEARWTIPHLARALPQVSREDTLSFATSRTAFGLRFIEPNDFYQKAYRAARYGILFVALTFLTVMLIERGTGAPVHPVQYILIGLAQTIFVLLMVAYAEHLGFGPAYLVSAGATIALLTGYGFLGLRLGRRALVLGIMLLVVYAVLYLILQSTDYALLAGSTLAFLALALTMFATRNEAWYDPEDADKPAKPGLMRRLLSEAPQQAGESPQAPPPPK